MSEQIAQFVRLDTLTIAENVRTSSGLDAASIKELSESIKTHGQLQPIIVAKTEEGAMHVIAGQRRTLAARLAGLDSILAIVVEGKDGAELKAKQIVENIQRENLNLADTCRGVRDMLAMLGKPAEVQRQLNKSSAWVSKHLAPTGPGFNQQVRDLIVDGQCQDIEMALTLNQIAKHPKGSTLVAHLIAQVQAGLIGRAKVRATLEQLKAPTEPDNEDGDEGGEGEEGGDDAPKGKQTISVDLSVELAAVYEALGGAAWLKRELNKARKAQQELPV